MPNLFDFDGSDYSLSEYKRIEPQRWISVFYPEISHLFRTALCLFNGFCWSGAPHGRSSCRYSGLLAGTIGERQKGWRGDTLCCLKRMIR
jgi:hypothetical protein